jgi:ankyrin repeat protein
MAGELIEAIEAGDAQRVRDLLNERPELADERDADGVSALLAALYRGASEIADAVRDAKNDLDVFEAAATGDVDRLRGLLDSDPALVHAWTSDGFTALHYAVFFDGAAPAALLLERGADANALATHPQIKVRPIHSAAASQQTESARLLLDHGADVNVRQEGGFTPLHSAAFHGDGTLAELLLERGADAALTTDEGKTAADVAAEKGHEQLAARLRDA